MDLSSAASLAVAAGVVAVWVGGVVLTAMAAVLAFLPLTLSPFWGPLAVVLIGGTLVGTGLTLFFLPALYALWMVRRDGSVRRADRPLEA